MFCRSICAAASLALALLAAPAAASLPAPVAAMLPALERVGQGTLRWFGLHVYDATLWAPGARFSFDGSFVLEIRYARSIPGARLAETSAEEIARLGATDAERLRRWEDAMRRVFPDVGAGDRLIGIHHPGRGATFWSGSRLLGSIEDAEFARAFFAIWLDPRTRKPDLRSALLGQP